MYVHVHVCCVYDTVSRSNAYSGHDNTPKCICMTLSRSDTYSGS